MAERQYHPWEGGEGKVSGQYVLAHVEAAKKVLGRGEFGQAVEFLQQALEYPINLGEGKLEGDWENHI